MPSDDIPPALLKTARRAWSYDREIAVQRIARLLLAERQRCARIASDGISTGWDGMDYYDHWMEVFNAD